MRIYYIILQQMPPRKSIHKDGLTNDLLASNPYLKDHPFDTLQKAFNEFENDMQKNV